MFIKASLNQLCGRSWVCVCVHICVWAGSACVHAVTCLMSQCLLKDEVAHLLVPAQGTHASPTLYSPQTHTHTHKALLLVARWHAPYTSPPHSSSVTLHLSNPSPVLFSLGFPFMCVPSALSEAFYCVTYTDSTAQCATCTAPLLLHMGKVAAFVFVATWCLAQSLHQLWGFMISIEIFLFLTPNVCLSVEIILLLSIAVSLYVPKSDSIFKNRITVCSHFPVVLNEKHPYPDTCTCNMTKKQCALHLSQQLFLHFYSTIYFSFITDVMNSQFPKIRTSCHLFIMPGQLIIGCCLCQKCLCNKKKKRWQNKFKKMP